MVCDNVFDLLSINRLIELIQQLNLVLSEEQDNLMFDMFITESINNTLPFFRTEIVLQTFSNLSADFLHYLHVWSLCYLSRYLYLVSMSRDLFDLVLSNFLVENLIIELFR